MSDAVITAIITGFFSFAGGVIIALIGAWAGVRKNLAEQFTKVHGDISDLRRDVDKMLNQLNPLWEIYGVEAIREARKGNLVVQNSPLRTSSAWAELIPEVVRQEVREAAIDQPEVDERSLAQTIIAKYLDELYPVSIEYDLPLQAIVGAAQVRIQELRRGVMESKDECI